MGGETVTVRMARGDRSTAWGFGVTDSGRGEVLIVNVVPGSLADRAGLRNGDILDILEGLNNLDLKATDRLLVTSRDRIELVVHRNTGASSTSAAGQARIWRPEITQDTHINKFQHSTHHIPAEQPPPPPQVRVSLEHSNTTQVPQGFNSSALPFNTDPRVKHAQYNSPLSLYSKQNAAEQYELQTSDLLNKMSLNGARGAAPQAGAGAPSFRSETMRLIQEEAARGGRGSTLSSHPNPNNLPTCFVCTRPILGVMARAAGHDVHGDCLSCATCGSSLKNVGHHFIDDKFYCDVHGSQKKGLLNRSAAPAAAPAARGPEPPKSFYQPDVMGRRPLSVSPNPAVHHQTSTYSTTTHLTNPKTHGPISPAARGVPTNPPFTATSRPVSPPSYAPPPPPATAPPTGGAPSQPLPMLTVNGAVPPSAPMPTPRSPSGSPRRAPRSPSFCVHPLRKQWPPPPGRHTIGAVPRYWDVAARRGEVSPGGTRAPATAPLADLVAEDDAALARAGGRRPRDPRRRTVVQPQLVADAREAVRRAAAHKEELAKRDEELAHRLQAPAIPKGINVIATRSEPLVARPEPRQAQQQPAAAAAAELQPRPVSYISEASTILSAPEVVQQIRPVSMVASMPPSMTTSEVAPPPARPQSMFSPLLRVNSSPVPFGAPRTFVDSATSPNPPPAYDPTTKPKAVAAATDAAPAPRAHRRVDISKQPPPPQKKAMKKKVNGVAKKTKKAEIDEVHAAPLTGVAPTHILHRGAFAAPSPRSPSPLVMSAQAPGAWASVAEVLDEADLGTEPRRSPEEAIEALPAPRSSRYAEREDIPRVRRPVYLPLDFAESQAAPVAPAPPRIAFDLVEDYEDSIVSSTALRPEMRRIMRMVDDDCESQETNEDWRKVNLSLLDEEGQWERDLATVGELNRRMRESTDRDPCGDDDAVSAVDEEDRQRAIESIERHQRTLERQQASLSVLLDSAITFLRGLDTAMPDAPLVSQAPQVLPGAPQVPQTLPDAPHAGVYHAPEVFPGAHQVPPAGAYHAPPVFAGAHQVPQTHPDAPRVFPGAPQALPAPPPRAFIPTATLSAVTAAAAAAQARRQPDEDESIES